MSNTTVIISGASSGIGAAIAQKYSHEGYHVLLLGRSEEKLKSVQNKLTTSSEYCSFDLQKFDQNREAINNKLEKMPTVSVLVNNAGIYHYESFEKTADDVWLEQFQVNLLSAVKLTKFVWPLFKEKKDGSIVNISSTLGIKPAPMTSAYSAVKAAMVNWTLSLAQEGGAHNIRANCICPGIVDTPIHYFHSLPEKQKNEAIAKMAQLQLLSEIGQPNDIAEAAYFLGSKLSKWTTGSVLNVDGGINIK